MYVNGLGFVNDSASIAATATANPNINNTSSNSEFDALLASETEKYNAKNPEKTYELKAIFEEAAEKYNVSYDMLTAIAWHESRFQPNVTSSAGAMGLMQLMPGTAEAMGVKDGYDPYENVMGAAKLLHTLSDMYDGDQTLTLAAYAAGTGSVAKYGGVPPYGETQEFVSTITKLLNNGGVTVPDETVTAYKDSSTNDMIAGTNDAYNAYNTLVSDASNPAYVTNPNLYDSFLNASKLDNVLSYQDYQLLMYFYENMMDIISNIGGDD